MKLRFAVIGSPVAHSKSPVMHAAAYAALKMPHAYEKIETSEGELKARVGALRNGEFAGLNVTVPHKTKVLALCDVVEDDAQSIGAANTLVVAPDGKVHAHNTDFGALVAELFVLARSREGDDFDFPESVSSLRGSTAIVLGTGGAARAAVAALVTYGPKRILVRGRKHDAKDDLQRIAGASEVVMQDLVAPAEEDPNTTCIVQATSCGMAGGPDGALVATAVHWDSLPRSALAYDVVYNPRETPFLARAKAREIRAENGLGMLARQGALAFELWLGVEAPLDVMRAALD